VGNLFENWNVKRWCSGSPAYGSSISLGYTGLIAGRLSLQIEDRSNNNIKLILKDIDNTKM